MSKRGDFWTSGRIVAVNEHVRYKAKERKGGGLLSLLLASLLILACPGDDVAALLAAYVPVVEQVFEGQKVDPTMILGMWYVDKRDKESRSDFSEGPDDTLLN